MKKITYELSEIWAENLLEEKNVMLLFQWKAPESSKIHIKIAAASAFQLFIDGRFIGYGPRRSAKGFSHINDYTEEIVEGKTLTAAVVSYRNDSYNLINEPPFFACAIKAGNARYKSEDFQVFRFNGKIQKIVRYSFQRNFAEAYRLSDDYMQILKGNHSLTPLKTIGVNGNILTESDLDYPTLEMLKADKIIESGTVVKKTEFNSSDINAQLYQGIIFDKREYEVDLIDEAFSLGFIPSENDASLHNKYRLYDFGINKTGFIFMNITAESDCDIYLLFDEILCEQENNKAEKKNELLFYRLGTVNVVKYSVKKGENHFLTIEPYTMRYLKVCIFGKCAIKDVGLHLLENPKAKNLELKTDDNELTAIFEAARNTFAQNAVDVPTDCPSRERAGWLCDSYFTAQSELLFTGENKVEKNFLESLESALPISGLPENMFPMCYPADHTAGVYIPNWALWLVLELENYLLRTGDRTTIENYRSKVYNLMDFFSGYENEYGLLENLESWIFVEWSRSNDLVGGINYPTNMLFARACKSVFILYGDAEFNTRYEKLKQVIIAQSFDGKFFRDQSIRNNGKLFFDGERTETCQYYAFFMGIASKESFPELFRVIFSEFGPSRDVSVCYPEIAKSNSFIGNYLRLDYLYSIGKGGQALSECNAYFNYMAERTGTLWENATVSASCNHGFASYVAKWIIGTLTGYRGFDPVSKTIFLSEPETKIKFSVKIPIGKELLILEKGKNPIVPEGFNVSII